VQILTDATADVVRDNYPLPGGGDVEIVLSFNFERADAGSTATFYFNASREGNGFTVRFDAGGVRAHHLDELVYEGDAVSMERRAVHELKLVTLGDVWALALNGKGIADGRLEPEDAANAGRLGVIVEQAGVRIVSCEESFITHDVDFPEWERGDLLYDETFGAESIAQNWVVNGERPTVAADSVTWNAMSVNMLRERFEGPIAIDCRVTPQEDSPKERDTGLVTDAIFIWMMQHPDGDLFEFMQGLETASLLNYMELPFYWVDFGGTNNMTTRVRRNPHRQMVRQFDARPHLLERYHTYDVTMVQNGHVNEFWVDGERWLQWWDPTPLTEGYIGFRAYVAGLKLHELKVWRIGR
jgi:rhamnogalacturonan endolyase